MLWSLMDRDKAFLAQLVGLLLSQWLHLTWVNYKQRYAMVKNHLRAPHGVYFTPKTYDSTAPVRRPAGGRKNRTIFDQFFRHRTVPGEV